MKKSNNMGGRTSGPRQHGAHWTGLKTRRHGEYNRIAACALALNSKYGRAAAIDYIQANRPWLADYIRPAELPASGALLDSWLRGY